MLLQVTYVFVCVSVVVGTFSGTPKNADDQCRKNFGPTSYLCREQYTTGYDYICSAPLCYNHKVQKCASGVTVDDGTVCGDGKWCISGTCTKSSAAPSAADPTCPLGDSKSNDVLNRHNCTYLADSRPVNCYDPIIANITCCESCKNVTLPLANLFAGPQANADKQCKATHGDKSYFCVGNRFYNGSYNAALCQKLLCHDPTVNECVRELAEDGTPCLPNHWCVAGECVASALASSDPIGDCLYGNRWHPFCRDNINARTAASYCLNTDYAGNCCDECAKYRNDSNTNCPYGDHKPTECQANVDPNKPGEYCVNHEPDCCETCPQYKDETNLVCPYGDRDHSRCEGYMNDTLGPGNCYNHLKQQECCETCPKYYNSSKVGCEYGDHWKDWCHENIKGSDIRHKCDQYGTQCCGTCQRIKEQGFPGCEFGDLDPDHCKNLVENTTLGAAHCYNIIERSQCCLTCHNLLNTSNIGCEYGDRDPGHCVPLTADEASRSNCYDPSNQAICCDTCKQLRDDSEPGCEYGNRIGAQSFCVSHVTNASHFQCFNIQNVATPCCGECNKYKISTHPDCLYGDKNPYLCRFQIPDDNAANAKCPTMGSQCCGTCKAHGIHVEHLLG